jgi:hypothetical protein
MISGFEVVKASLHVGKKVGTHPLFLVRKINRHFFGAGAALLLIDLIGVLPVPIW